MKNVRFNFSQFQPKNQPKWVYISVYQIYRLAEKWLKVVEINQYQPIKPWLIQPKSTSFNQYQPLINQLMQ